MKPAELTSQGMKKWFVYGLGWFLQVRRPLDDEDNFYSQPKGRLREDHGGDQLVGVLKRVREADVAGGYGSAGTLQSWVGGSGGSDRTEYIRCDERSGR